MQSQPPNPELAAPPNLFLLYPENRAFLDGTGSIVSDGSLSRRSMRILVALLTLIVVACLAFITLNWANHYSLQTNGVEAEAIVVDRRMNCGEGCSHFLSYSYVVDDHEYIREQQVNSSRYESLLIGAATPIVYDPGNPSFASLKSGVSFETSWIALLFAAIALYYILKIAIRWMKVNRLSNGQLLLGQLTNYAAGKDEEDEYYVIASYSFAIEKGYFLHGQTIRIVSEKVHKNAAPASPGTPVAVLYVNDDFHRML